MAETALLAQEAFLVELAQWMSRVAQYSAGHRACAPHAERTLAALRRALELEPVVACGILKDNVLIGDTLASHPAVKTRIAPHLHERGVLSIRFNRGTAMDELAALVELLAVPVQTTFDRGGLLRLARERGIVRIELEELAHDITAEERDAQRRRTEIRDYFADELRRLLASRAGALAGRRLLELLDYPDVAVTILEEDPVGLAETVAGLCLMVQQEEQRTGHELYPKLRTILLALSPGSHERVVLGLPALVGEFRQALVWGLDGLDEGQLAGFAFPAVRRNATELDVVFYAIGAAVPHDGRRYSTLRRLALFLYDLPLDDSAASALLERLSAEPPEFDSYRQERWCLAPHARRALAARAPLFAPATAAARPVAFDARRTIEDLVRVASRTRRFAQLCDKLPAISASFAQANSLDAVAGIVRGLRDVTRPEARPIAQAALRAVASPELTARLLDELDTTSASVDGAELEEVAATVKLVVALAPAAALERLDRSESRKMRRILLDALSTAGSSILPLVRGQLSSAAWYVVRNGVLLLPRVGGTAKDLQGVARHPNEKVRLEIVRALRAVPQDADVMDIVAGYVSDASLDVRKAAAPMLRGDLLGPRAIELLEQVACDDRHAEALRWRVVEVLGRSPHDGAAAALFRLIHPRGLIDLGSLRELAATALRRSPAPAAAAHFAEGLRSPVFRVRKACERAAGGG